MVRFEVTFQPGGYGMFFVNGRKIDGDKHTVAYYIRHMCGLPHLKRPAHLKVYAACEAAKETGKPATLVVD